jgi:hypothetical protein
MLSQLQVLNHLRNKACLHLKIITLALIPPRQYPKNVRVQNQVQIKKSSHQVSSSYLFSTGNKRQKPNSNSLKDLSSEEIQEPEGQSIDKT